MTVVYRQQGMALGVYIVIDGIEYYCGFWWSYLNFVDTGKDIDSIHTHEAKE